MMARASTETVRFTAPVVDEIPRQRLDVAVEDEAHDLARADSTTGEPLLPPTMSLVVTKLKGVAGSSCALRSSQRAGAIVRRCSPVLGLPLEETGELRERRPRAGRPRCSPSPRRTTTAACRSRPGYASCPASRRSPARSACTRRARRCVTLVLVAAYAARAPPGPSRARARSAGPSTRRPPPGPPRRSPAARPGRRASCRPIELRGASRRRSCRRAPPSTTGSSAPSVDARSGKRVRELGLLDRLVDGRRRIELPFERRAARVGELRQPLRVGLGVLRGEPDHLRREPKRRVVKPAPPSKRVYRDGIGGKSRRAFAISRPTGRRTRRERGVRGHGVAQRAPPLRAFAPSARGPQARSGRGST